MDQLSAMRAFVSVVESGGFSSAARRLDVSKAQVSKQLAQLEEHLGVRLLHRTTRRVTTTSSGQAYFEQCRPLLNELSELDDAVQSNHSSPRGELRVTAPTTFAELHLMPAIAEFARRFDAVRVTLDLSDRFVNLVEERIDVAIRIGNLVDSSLVARKLGNTSMLVCAAPAYLAERGEPRRTEQLAQHRCVLDNNYPGGVRWTLGQGKRARTVTINADIVVNSARAARELLLAGQGVGYLPSFAVADDIAQGRLVRLLSAHVSEPIGIYALYVHRKHLSPKVQRFIETIIENCKATFIDG